MPNAGGIKRIQSQKIWTGKCPTEVTQLKQEIRNLYLCCMHPPHPSNDGNTGSKFPCSPWWEWNCAAPRTCLTNETKEGVGQVWQIVFTLPAHSDSAAKSTVLRKSQRLNQSSAEIVVIYAPTLHSAMIPQNLWPMGQRFATLICRLHKQINRSP